MDTTPLNSCHPSLRTKQQRSLDMEEEDGVGCDSNSVESGSSETEFGIVHSDSIVLGSISTTEGRLASLNESNNSTEDVPLLLHNSTHSRANFSQFETPADETRNNFGPDDFDEQLFIGQLETNCTEAPQFDEELETPVIMDTADHSESSDVEELYEETMANNFPHQSNGEPFTTVSTNDDMNDSTTTSFVVTSPASNQSRHRLSVTSVARRKNNQGQRHDRILTTHTSFAQSKLRIRKDDEEKELVECLHEEDLTCDNALNNESPTDHHNHIPICLNVINSTDDKNLEEEQSTSQSSTSMDCLKSSPVRKRKGDPAIDSPDDTLPSKKPVTDDDVDEFSNGGGPMTDQTDKQILDSPCEIVEENDDEIFEEARESPYMSLDESSSSVLCGPAIRSIIPSKAYPPPRMGEWLQIFSSWSHPERLMAITELIGTCEATQVRHMMQIIEPQFQRDFISLLPKELALYVLSFLDPRDLLRAAQTCKYWRVLADDNLLWREKCKEAGVGYFSAMSSRVHRRNRNPANPPNTAPSSSDVPTTRWKAAFMKQHYVEMNWKRKDVRDHKVLKGHDDHVITCLQFSSNRIVSGSDDNTLKVWSATTGKCLRTLLGHTGGVWSSQMSGTTIVSGSTDRTLRVWNAETGHCLHTLYGHTSTVRCMHLHERKVVSGSRDATLRMWDVETGECLHVLVGHMAAVRCVQYNGHLVVSGAYDYMVRIWDPEREECLHQLSGHTNRVYSLQFDGIHVVSGSLDTSIRVWDVETGACRHTLMGHQSLTSGMELRDNLLVSGNADSTVKIWDISTGQCLLTLTGPNKHLSAVTCLQLINKFVITSSDDGTVKLWEIRTGDFVRNLVSLSSGGSGGVVWRIRASETKLVCAVGSRNGTEETKLLVLDFDTETPKAEPKVDVKNEIQVDY